MDWINKNPKVDSQYIQTLHRLSYRYSEKEVKKSYDYYQQVAALSDSLNFTFGKALAQINLGILLFNSASFTASNNAFFKAIDYAEACGSLRLKSVSLNNAADNFLSLRNFDKSRQYTNAAIPVNIRLKAWRGVAINYELLHRCDFNQRLYSKARDDLKKGMPYAKLAGESYIYSQYDVGLGKLQAVAGNYDSAEYYFAKAVDEAKLQKDVRNEFQAYLAEAQYLKNLSPGRKLILLDTALSISKYTQYY